MYLQASAAKISPSNILCYMVKGVYSNAKEVNYTHMYACMIVFPVDLFHIVGDLEN